MCLGDDAGWSPIKFGFPEESLCFKLHSKQERKRKQIIKNLPGRRKNKARTPEIPFNK